METGSLPIRILNRKQTIVILAALLLLILLAVLPPWRYLDGSFAGFAPVGSPPDPLPDSLITGEIAAEYVPIKIVPMGLNEIDRKTQFTREELARPFIDVRKMLMAGTILFLIAVILVFALDDRTRKPAVERLELRKARRDKARS